MNTLDQRLHAWLLEPEEQRFEQAFNAYYGVAYPAVLRRLARLSGWDRAQLEELAQDVLLKFFERVGRGRRESSRLVADAAAVIRALGMSDRHGQLNEWLRDVEAFRIAATGFRWPCAAESGDSAAKHAIRSLAELIAPLQVRGRQLIDDLRAVAERLPAAAQFIEQAVLVIEAMPRLRVPSNAYLFDIAQSMYLDECKKRGRHKRGGRVSSAERGGFRGHGDGAVARSIEELALETEAGLDAEEFSATPLDLSRASEPLASDPTRRYEDAEFLARFYEHLRMPVEEATDAFLKAQAKGEALAERRRMDSLKQKFSRIIAVLSMIGEGHTQDQAAEQLGISRNQVKYTLALVQEAHARFDSTATATATATAAPARALPGIQPHVS